MTGARLALGLAGGARGWAAGRVIWCSTDMGLGWRYQPPGNCEHNLHLEQGRSMQCLKVKSTMINFCTI